MTQEEADIKKRSSDRRTITYPAPEGEELSKDYTVEVNGQLVDVYTARVNDPPHEHLDHGGTYSFAYFDFAGSVTIKICSLDNRSMQNARIRPISRGIKHSLIDATTTTITLDKPCKFSFEPQGKRRPLLIFANPIEEDIPDENAENVIYFGPGLHRPADGKIELRSNQTLYIAGGAVVQAGLEVRGENITIRGRGILCGNSWPWRKGPTRHMIDIMECSDVAIEGIICRGSWIWTIVLKASENVVISNVKLCGGRVFNDDGINPCNSRHILIRDCFIRSDDDCIALKGLETEWGDLDDILVEDTVLWCDRARITLLAHESRAAHMKNIIYRNIDVVHFVMPIFLIEPGEEMVIENVLFEDWRINGEEQSRLATIRPTINQYMRKKVPGHVNNIRFKDIKVFGSAGEYGILIEGADDDHQTENISFENFRILDELLTENSPNLHIGEYVKGVST